MHDDLHALDTALPRLMHDTLVHAVRRNRTVTMVRLAIPDAWDTQAVIDGMQALYAARGWEGVQVVVLPTTGDPRVLSVVT